MRRFNPFILSSVSLAAIIASPAVAQQTQSDKSPPATLTSEQEIKSGEDAQSSTNTTANPNPTSNEAITVTGSRIRRPNLESPLPVTSVGGEEFFQTGNVSVGDKLAELPSIRSTFTQANSTRFLGTSGLNLLDLRGLGTTRTLVLVNGRRHVGGDVLSSGVSVDVNTIPTDLIDRVDVVTGGNSAVYGSDAIAGVVNFVLKQDYEGIQVRGQGGVSQYGDAGAYFISGLYGKNFGGGRGNVAVNVEWAKRDQAFGANRSWFRKNITTVDSNPAGTPNGSDGVPDRILNPDFRSATFSNTGTVRIGGQNAATGATVPFNCGLDPQGNGYNCPFIFLPSGQLVPQTGVRVGLGPSGQFIGGNGEGFFNGHQVQVQPRLDRLNINLLGHFEISPAIVPFVEATWAHTKSTGQGGSGPFFISGQTLGDPFRFQFSGGSSSNTRPGNREAISLNSPFLDPAARTTITNAILASGVNNCNFAPLNATDRARITAGTFRFCEQLNWTGLGNRIEVAKRDTYRIVAGLRGDLGGSWNYELSANYGRLDEKTRIEGNVDVQRMLLAMDAVRDPATGNIVCASKIDPSRAFGYGPWYYGTDPNADAKLAADIAACTPINPLGGQVTDAQRAYVQTSTIAKGRTSQLDLLGFISGDSSKWFELPGGPIGVVLGAEYREDNLYYNQDPLVSLGYTFYNAIPTFKAPKAKVTEGFAEVRLPILKDRPFVNELEVDGAARVSHYTLGTTGTVWAYNVNAVYSPVAGVRFRGNYGRAVRAPNQSELFSPFGQNFSLVTDPCDVNQVGAGTSSRAANCIAAGVPAGQRITYSSSLPFQSGGNVDLQAEKSDSWTLGGVLTPRFIPGFSLSVDYYNIKVKKVITSPTAQQIINACYDQPDLNNQFCALFTRDPTGAKANNGQLFGIVSNSLKQQPLNYALRRARGIDTELAFRRNIGDLGRLDTRLTWTHVLERTNFQNPAFPKFGDRILSELGDPQDAFNWNTSLQHGRFTLGYQMRYVSKMVVNAYEDFFPFKEACLPNGCPPNNKDWFTQAYFPAVFYHDVRFGVDVGPKYNFYVGADNVTNKKPPLYNSGIGAGSAIYDAIGRFWYAGVKAKF